MAADPGHDSKALPDAQRTIGKREIYRSLTAQLESLLAGERDAIANAANMSALLYSALPDINWVGFYWLRGDQLVVGPFQGKPACVRIPVGQGVCGTVAASQQPLIVPNVHEYAGHIACDTASNSEIVLPLMTQSVIGVLDLDSPILNRFDEDDLAGLQRLVDIYLDSTDV